MTALRALSVSMLPSQLLATAHFAGVSIPMRHGYWP
jgi:hypothetical protein